MKNTPATILIICAEDFGLLSRSELGIRIAPLYKPIKINPSILYVELYLSEYTHAVVTVAQA